MITAKDHLTGDLFDQWEHLGPKRRKLLQSSWPGVFRTYLLEKLPVGKVAKHFDKDMGRPSKDLYTAIGSIILQQLHDLSDPEVTRALAFNIDWHYALDITGESDDATYVSERTLRSYRKILIDEGLDSVLFETLTDTLIDTFKVDTTKQRLDSTHIKSNMRKLGRIRIFTDTITKFLKKLKRSHQNLYKDLIESSLNERYLAKDSDGCFARVKPSRAGKTLAKLAHDLLYLVELFASYEEVTALSEYKMLQRVLEEQCRVTGSGADAQVEIKPPKEVPSDSLQNPSDPDASYDGHKGQGYQGQFMETYTTEKEDEETLHLITHVAVEPAHKHDSGALQPAIDTTQARDCCPEKLTCDTHYGSDDNVQEAAAKGVDVIAPVQGISPSHEIHLDDFTFDEETQYVITCPEGHTPETVSRTRKQIIRARFRKNTCCNCHRRDNCPVTIGKKAAYLRYTDKMLRLAKRRTYERTKEFLDKYRWRAGIEGTNSHLKSDVGIGRLRVRGMASVRFAVTLKALGLNILRCGKALTAVFDPSFIHFHGIFGYIRVLIYKMCVFLRILALENKCVYCF